MSLVFGPSALCVSSDDQDIFFSGVGSFLRVYKREQIISEHLIFPSHMRIVHLSTNGSKLLSFAEDIIQVVEFSDDYSKINIVMSQTLPDWITAASFTSTGLKAILRHGQTVFFDDNWTYSISELNDSRLLTAALIVEDQFFFGDSLGTISLLNNFDFPTKYGIVFGLSVSPDGSKLLAAQYKTVVMWNIVDGGLEEVWTFAYFPARVWGTSFPPIGPISYGEDGCVHIHDGTDRVLNLHRTKNVTALTFTDNKIITAGTDGLIRINDFPRAFPEPETFPMDHNPITSIVLPDMSVVCGNVDGSVYRLPLNEEIISPKEGKKVGWFILKSYENTVFGASQDRKHFFYDGKEARMFPHPENAATCALSLNSTHISVVYTDNILKVYKIDGTEIASIDLAEYFFKSPSIVAIHPTEPFVGLGLLSVVRVINYENCEISKEFKTTSKDGFQAMRFINGILYTAGRTDGQVTIFSKLHDHWEKKSSWRIPELCRTTIDFSENQKNSPVISTLMKDSIAVWDMETQTCLVQFPFDGNKSRLHVCVRENQVTASWCDNKHVFIRQNVDSLSSKSIGEKFHGLRGLCSSYTDDYLVTGGCDRDIRLWKLVPELKCIDWVQGIDSGHHSIAINDQGLVFTAGQKLILNVWKIADDKLYIKHEFNLQDYGLDSICSCKIRSITISQNNRLYLCMSDVSVCIFDYEDDDLVFIERKEVLGVPMSSSYAEEWVGVVTSSGDVYFYKDDEEKHVRPLKCGAHCIRMFSNKENRIFYILASDDGKVSIFDFETNQIVFEIEDAHTGAAKCVDVLCSNVLKLVSFGYDQRIQYREIDISPFKVIEAKTYDTSIFDGETIHFYKDGFVILGAGVQYYQL